ncbi:hypothetical protein NDN08_003594 [Rhodosorus marinus]|uniref:Signal recognition particle 9 kDa protein n=1 Tax=Rhodosorus marinus TaxID=101924 RepID=A0AAV8V0M6_9RHOD|nr:hypothetical protein NDN08_003594 [Rhodosorus marinus]
MVYYKDWDRFYEASLRMFIKAPEKTRYSFKYRGVRKILVLTVTNSSKVLKFRTDQRADIRKMERLTEWMLLRMTSPLTKEEIQTEFASLLEGEAAN